MKQEFCDFVKPAIDKTLSDALVGKKIRVSFCEIYYDSNTKIPEDWMENRVAEFVVTSVRFIEDDGNSWVRFNNAYDFAFSGGEASFEVVE